MINVVYLHETAEVSGAENSLLQLMRAVDRKKVRPVFVCPARGSFGDELRELDVRVYDFFYPALRGIRGVSRALAALRRIIRHEDAHILHGQSIRTDMYAVLARGAGQRVIWHMRNLRGESDAVDPERMLWFLPDRVICNSQAVRRRLAWGTFYPGRSCVVYSGVDTLAFSPSIDGSALRRELGIPPEARVVGIASRFHPMKGHDFFLRAAREVLTRSSGRYTPVFLVAGSAVFEEAQYREKELRQTVTALHLESDVVFAGFRQDMPAVLAAMDMLVLPSASEACGRVVLEAMASSRAVLGTRTGGTPELIEDGVTGILFTPGNVEELAAHIDSLCADPGRAGAMGRAGRARACAEFSIDTAARSMEKIYEELSA